MNVLYEKSSRSRFSALENLARTCVQAPLGPKGAPLVYIELSRHQGAAALVTQTSDPVDDTCLVLRDTEQGLLEQDLKYVVSRLESAGMHVELGKRP